MATRFKLPTVKRTFWSRVRLFLFLVSLARSGAIYAENTGEGYQLGRGYLLSETGIRLGGYASLGAQGLGSQPWEVRANDLSLFVSWVGQGKLSFFSETELNNVLTAGQNQSLTTGNADIVVERLYLDYRFNDALVIRLGKFLSPVGQWNVIHAAPLVWTTNRPVATENLFADHVVGFMLHGSVPIDQHYLDYSVYADYDSAIDPEPKGTVGFDNAVGMRLQYGVTDNLLIGLSYANFALIDNPATRNNLLGLDVAWEYQGFSVTSEIVYRNNDSQLNSHFWQGFLQGVAPTFVINNVYAIGRYEFFDQANNRFGQVGVLGLAYRPMPPLTFKLEYRLGENNRELAPTGLFTSIAVLF